MIDAFVLNIIIVAYFLLVYWEDNVKPQLNEITKKKIEISPSYLGILLTIGFISLIAFMIFGSKTAVRSYVLFSFSLLTVGHALWLSFNQKLIRKLIAILFSIAFILVELIYPSELIHNIFLTFSTAWLAALFTVTNILTIKRFVSISIVWILYDIYYVWLSGLSKDIHDTTTTIGFPLAIGFRHSSIGIADLLFGSMLILLIADKKWRLLSIVALIISNVLLDIYAYTIGNIEVFPLLVLWGPIGLVIIYLYKQRHFIKV